MASINVATLLETNQHHRIDAEFYQPEYSIDFSKGRWEPIKKHLYVCQYGISQAMSEEPEGYPIFRMDDIKAGFVLDDELKYLEIPGTVFDQFRLEINDVLFNRVNAENFVGRTGIFKLRGDYVFASYLVRVRVKRNSSILPDYLNIFLNSKYGKKQIRRFMRRAVNQANVNAEELKNFKIFLAPQRLQKEILNLSDEAWKYVEISKSLYKDAEILILNELNLGKFRMRYRTTYTNTLMKAYGVHRLDAEHFQPAIENLIQNIRKNDFITIQEAQKFNRRGIQPVYVDDGEVPVVTSKNLGKTSVDYDNLTRTNIEQWEANENARVKKYDILTYTTGAYVGRTNCFLEDIKAIASNHVNILRIGYLNPVYTAVFLNSILGQAQVRKYVSGSAQAELYPSDLQKFIIWKAPQKIQEKAASMIEKSHEAGKKATELLKEARKKVEREIERNG